jgi:hypothetical protein
MTECVLAEFFVELGDAHTFSIKNNGTEPFQMLTITVKID